MTDTKSKSKSKSNLYINLDINIIPCTDLHGIIAQYYYGLQIEYISIDGIKSIEWVSSKKLTYDTKRRHELVSITGSGVYYLDQKELFKDCIDSIILKFNISISFNLFININIIVIC